MALRIYTDTSVFGGCADIEFRTSSIRLFNRFELGEFTIVVSDITLRELEAAPEIVKSTLRRIPSAHIERVETGEAAEILADSYVAHGAIVGRMYADALHMAIASVSRVDVLVSWNFKHMVNLKRIRAYNEVNRECGYPELEIRTPIEVIEL